MISDEKGIVVAETTYERDESLLREAVAEGRRFSQTSRGRGWIMNAKPWEKKDD
jgi:hypothetical protein